MEPSPEDIGIVREWFVAFKKSPPRNWLHRVFCRRGFTHCYLMGFDRRSGFGVTLETLFWKTEIRIVTSAELDVIVPMAIQQGQVLVYRAPPHPVSEFHRHFSCVGIVCHILGIRSKWVFSPSRLYQELKRLGAVELRDGNSACRWHIS